LDAEIIGNQRLRFRKTRPANWNPRDLAEGLRAQAALIGEQQGEKGVGELSDKGRRELDGGSFR
jgi:hypothetical protein